MATSPDYLPEMGIRYAKMERPPGDQSGPTNFYKPEETKKEYDRDRRSSHRTVGSGLARHFTGIDALTFQRLRSAELTPLIG